MQAQCPVCKTLIDLDGEICVCPGCERTLALPPSMRSQPPPPTAQFAPDPPHSELPPERAEGYDLGDDPIAAARQAQRNYESQPARMVRKQLERADKRSRKEKRKRAKLAKSTLGAQILLYFVGAVNIAPGIALLLMNPRGVPPGVSLKLLGAMCILDGLIMVGLAVWARSRPIPALAIAIILLFLALFFDVIIMARAQASPNLSALILRVALILGLTGVMVRAKEEQERRY